MALNARTLFLICWTSASWAFSFGLGTQVVSHWLKAQEQSETVIGLSHSFYYFGMAVGSFAVPWLVRRLGPAWCATLGMIFSGVTLALFPTGGFEAGWYLLRFLNGWASAMCLVPLETIVSRDSTPATKTRNFAYYGVSLTIGGALGIGVWPQLFQPAGVLAFSLGGCVPFLTGFVLLRGMRQYPHPTEGADVQTSASFGSNFLSYGTAWAQGFLEGGMLAFLSLYLLWRGDADGRHHGWCDPIPGAGVMAGDSLWQGADLARLLRRRSGGSFGNPLDVERAHPCDRAILLRRMHWSHVSARSSHVERSDA